MFRLNPPPNGSVSHFHPPTFFSLSLWSDLREPANYTDRATAACRRSQRQRDGSLLPYSRISRPWPLLLLSSSSSIVLYSRGWANPVPDPLLVRKSASAGNRTRTTGPHRRSWGHRTGSSRQLSESVDRSSWSFVWWRRVIWYIVRFNPEDGSAAQ
jgi:hypothetical protein